jgi:hypothetical protein
MLNVDHFKILSKDSRAIEKFLIYIYEVKLEYYTKN